MPHTQPDHLTNLPAQVRHFHWNDDYIELLAHKLQLHTLKTVVDIGSGLDGLTGLFGLYMKPGAKVYGFDRDAELVRAAQASADSRPYSVKFEFAVAEPTALPLADGAADLVICQHLLANVADPARVLAEMCRLVRPGGKVVAFEPNGAAQALVLDAVEAEATVEERVRDVRFQLCYEAGKRARGEGDDSVGDRLPQLFAAAKLRVLDVRLSDKAGALVPPYDTPEKQARAAELRGWAVGFNRNQGLMRERFLAGGGDEADYEAYRARELAQHDKICEGLDAGTYVHPGGQLTYIAIGQK